MSDDLTKDPVSIQWGVYALDGTLFQTRPTQTGALQWGARWMKVPYIVRKTMVGGKFLHPCPGCGLEIKVVRSFRPTQVQHTEKQPS